ncbi:hypothetical protein BH10PSE15_BH10PSE15_01970 [soil metagenome]
MLERRHPHPWYLLEKDRSAIHYTCRQERHNDITICVIVTTRLGSLVLQGRAIWMEFA